MFPVVDQASWKGKQIDEIIHKEDVSNPALQVSCKGKGAVRETAN